MQELAISSIEPKLVIGPATRRLLEVPSFVSAFEALLHSRGYCSGSNLPVFHEALDELRQRSLLRSRMLLAISDMQNKASEPASQTALRSLFRLVAQDS
jgi:hypothetical protein